MRWINGLAVALLSTALPTHAETALAPPLAPLAFLVGDWAGTGKIEDGGTSRGTSSIHPAVGGGALLRQDHTDLFAADGHATGGFDQIMLIYPEAGSLHADYLDGQHVIHYTAASIDPAGESVTFSTAPAPDRPQFRLSYARHPPAVLHIKFEMAPPGAPGFVTVAEGDAERRP